MHDPCIFGHMTYREVIALPENVPVRLEDGTIGRITWWFHAASSVAIRRDQGGATLIVKAQDLHWTADGAVKQVSATGRD
jgi:hypothetical protein